MNILLIGSGGREHALAWKLAQSPRTEKLFIAPGNGGTAHVGENVPIAATDIEALMAFAKEHHIDLVVVGPDDPLAAGIVDRFKKEGIVIFGPTQAAAEIESSKAFAKRLMAEEGIPTAKFKTFTNHAEALEYVKSQGAPIVVKASGLALGKGAIVCATLADAEKALKEIMIDRVFGEAGNEVVVEEFLKGPEVSIHVFSDGRTHVFMPTAQDHKPVGDGGTGPNTGGMGTIAPVPWVTPELLNEMERTVVTPTLEGMAKRDRPLAGCLYPGLMITKEGPKVLEFNARFGDPETQSFMRLLKTDLVDILEACAQGTLGKVSVEWHPGYAVCVVIASGGYPNTYTKGHAISGIADAEQQEGIVVFQAGTKQQEDGALVTSGGRVLSVTAVGTTLPEAIKKAYAAIPAIHFEGMYYRTDIGQKSVEP